MVNGSIRRAAVLDVALPWDSDEKTRGIIFGFGMVDFEVEIF